MARSVDCRVKVREASGKEYVVQALMTKREAAGYVRRMNQLASPGMEYFAEVYSSQAKLWQRCSEEQQSGE